MSQQICSSNYFKEGRRVGELKRRLMWDGEGWRESGEVSSRDYEMIGLERPGEGIFMSFLL